MSMVTIIRSDAENIVVNNVDDMQVIGRLLMIDLNSGGIRTFMLGKDDWVDTGVGLVVGPQETWRY